MSERTCMEETRFIVILITAGSETDGVVAFYCCVSKTETITTLLVIFCPLLANMTDYCGWRGKSEKSN